MRLRSAQNSIETGSAVGGMDQANTSAVLGLPKLVVHSIVEDLLGTQFTVVSSSLMSVGLDSIAAVELTSLLSKESGI